MQQCHCWIDTRGDAQKQVCVVSAPPAAASMARHLLLPAASLPPAALWFSFLKTLVGLNFPLDFLSSFSCCFCKSAGETSTGSAIEVHRQSFKYVYQPLFSIVASKSLSSPLSLVTQREICLGRTAETPTEMFGVFFAFANLCMSRSRLLMIRFLWSMMDTISFSSFCSLSRSSWVQSHSWVFYGMTTVFNAQQKNKTKQSLPGIGFCHLICKVLRIKWSKCLPCTEFAATKRKKKNPRSGAVS